MSVLKDFRRNTIERFPGLDDFSRPSDSDGAQLATNVVYERDRVQTRTGFELYKQFTTTSPLPGGYAIQGIRSLHHWLSATWQRLVFFSKGADDGSVLPFITHHNIDINTREDVVRDLPSTAVWAGFAEYGSRIFMYFLKADGSAASPGRVWNGLFNSALGTPGPVVDTLFQDHLYQGSDFNASYSEPGVGLIEAGDHTIGLVFATRNGHETKAVELTTAFTATGDMSFRITLTPVTTWPLWVDYIKPLMSTVQNPELLYFIPETSVSPLVGTSIAVLIDINLTDEEMAAAATEATDWFDLATDNDTGSIKFAGVYGSRMVYISDIADAGTLGRVSHIWFSERDDPQRLFAASSIRHLPEKRTAVCAQTLMGTCYVLGPNWTYAFNDTTDVPVAWFQPETISDSIGVVHPGCVTTAQALNILWVASKHGLYAFNGQAYTLLPASYQQTATWERIYWAAPPNAFKMVDFPREQRLEFLVPLDGSTIATHKMTWNYQNGTAQDKLKFSLDDFRHSSGEKWYVGSMDVVQNPTTKRQEIWMTDEFADTVYRQMNPTHDDEPYNDNGVGIDSRWISQNLCPLQTAPARQAGAHLQVSGEGTAHVRFWGYLLKRATKFRPVEVERQDTKMRFVAADEKFASEQAYLEISNDNEANHWWELSRIVHYWKEFMDKRRTR